MIEDAARAGVRGIICEKPFVASPAELERVHQVAEETGVKIVVAHIRRYQPGFQRARELYNDGTVGEPLMCIASIAGWDLSEWGSHWLDMFRFFHNDQPINWVMGQARVRDTRGYGPALEDHAVAYFEFENGGKAVLDGGMTMNGGATMTLIGTRGTIRVFGEDRLVITNAQGECEENFANHPENGWPSVWDKTLAGLISWIEGGEVPLVGLPCVFQSSELNLAAYLSALRGDRVDLPLSDELKKYDEWPLEAMARRV
jgi:predicted dehydrogenase